MTTKSQSAARGDYQALGDEDHEDGKVNAQGESPLPTVPLSRASLLWLYMGLSAFVGFVLAIVLVNIFPGDVRGEGYGNSKLKELLRMPKKELLFSPMDLFQGPPSRESDAAWESLLGPSLGLIALNDSLSYGLPTGAAAVNDDSANVYQLTVTHQIQCLFLIRKVYFGENKGIYSTSTTTPSLLVQQTNECFDYLLQSIKCAADLTLESRTDESGNFVAWGEKHRCARWESVMDFMVDHRYAEAEKAVDHHHDDDDD